MEKRFSRPTNTHQGDQDYAFFISLLPSVKQLNQIEKMRLRMKIMNDVTDALEAHQFVKEVNSPIDSPCRHHTVLKVPSILNHLQCRFKGIKHIRLKYNLHNRISIT